MAVLWHRDLDATPIGDIGSDQTCGIQFQEDELRDKLSYWSVHALSQLGNGVLPRSVGGIGEDSS